MASTGSDALGLSNSTLSVSAENFKHNARLKKIRQRRISANSWTMAEKICEEL